MIQEKALEHMKSGRNVFLTGQPGTGKTYTINQFINWCLDNGKEPKVTASTGIAAIHVGGSTIHSWCSVYNDNELSTEDVEDILDNTYTRDRIARTEILIIDEISMVSAKLLNVVNVLSMAAKNSKEPFGGMQVICVGDFYQLPPVKGDFAFKAESWKMADFQCCYLHEQYRQSEGAFIDILTGVRAGVLSDEQKQMIRDRVVDDISGEEGVIRLDTHNAKVDRINSMKLDRLEGKVRVYKMDERGNEKAVKGLKANCLSPEKLFLKVGAPVLFTKNDPDKLFVNGTQGVVEELGEYSVKVRTQDDVLVEVGEMSWERAEGYGGNKNVIAMISQIPLKLAWAITIHKSQGMTLDKAVIDVSDVFAEGQAYVAISRVRSLEGVFLQGKLTGKFLSVNDDVKNIDKAFMAEGM